MKAWFSNERLSRYFEAIVIGALRLLLMVVIAIAVFDLWTILLTAVFGDPLAELTSVPDLQGAVQRSC